MTEKIMITYNERIERNNEILTKLKKRSRITSYLRALIFLIIFTGIIYYSSINSNLLGIGIIILLSFFILLVKRNIALKKTIKKTKKLIQINKNEILALKGDYSSFYNGNIYADHDHPYSYDLDIFGNGSLFQFINRTVTINGKNKLADTLTNKILDKETILKRQNAIRELAGKLDWRQKVSATALAYDENYEENIDKKEDIILSRLINWADYKLKFVHQRIWKVSIILFPTVALTILILSILNIVPFSFLILFGFLNLSIIGINIKKINSEHSKLTKTKNYLQTIKGLLILVEDEDFKTEVLKKLSDRLKKNKSASEQINKLSKLLQSFDTRLNFIAGVILNMVLLWDLQILVRLEKLKAVLKKEIPEWYDVISEFDSFMSLSNYAYNNPEFTYPTISDKDFYFHTKDGKHPLIPKEKSVGNDFKIDGFKRITIVTGANMAGKSTFLRTVGIHMVLGMIGVPVSVKDLEFTPIQIFTSVRTSDSLFKNESYFYAELMRLKKITDTLKSGDKLFIIMDEMLKGTNSEDKHKGSYSLIKQLIKYNASGLAATHDTQLGLMEEEFPDNISNKRFEVEIRNEELLFDYKLKDGISKSLNATFLMKKYGIIE